MTVLEFFLTPKLPRAETFPVSRPQFILQEDGDMGMPGSLP